MIMSTEYRLSLREPRPSKKDSKLWTASRCQRLLRPIHTRLESLRKLNLRKGYTHEPTKDSLPSDGSRIPPQLSTTIVSELSDANITDEDEDYRPYQRRSRRTYCASRLPEHDQGQRLRKGPWGCRRLGTSRKRIANRRDGEVILTSFCLSDTFVTESVVNDSSERTADVTTSRHRTEHGQLCSASNEMLKRLKEDTDVELYTIFTGLFDALHNLLRATQSGTESEQATRTGARSLFSTCLRAIPNVIEQEETWIENHREEIGIQSISDMPDLAAEMYERLEGLNIAPSTSSRLAPVVCAHAIKSIGNAIVDGAIPDKCAEVLIFLCAELDVESGQTLLERSLQRSVFPCPDSLHDSFSKHPALYYLSTVKRFSFHTNNSDYEYIHLWRLFNSGLLPITWATTEKLLPLWSQLLRQLHEHSISAAGFKLLSVVLEKCFAAICSKSEQYDSALATTYQSMLEILAVMAVSVSLPKQDEPHATQFRVIELLERVIASCPMMGASESKASLLLSACYIFSSSVLHSTSATSVQFSGNRGIGHILQQSHQCLIRHLRTIGKSAQQDLVELICSIAKKGDHLIGRDAFEIVKLCLDQLGAIPKDSPHRSRALNRVVVDAAYKFAQHTGQRSHLEYAETLNIAPLKSFFMSPFPPTTNSKTQSSIRQRLRWEDGIGEWVGVTPALNQNMLRNSSIVKTYDTPSRSRPRQLVNGRDNRSDTDSDTDNVSGNLSSPQAQISPLKATNRQMDKIVVATAKSSMMTYAQVHNQQSASCISLRRFKGYMTRSTHACARVRYAEADSETSSADEGTKPNNKTLRRSHTRSRDPSMDNGHSAVNVSECLGSDSKYEGSRSPSLADNLIPRGRRRLFVNYAEIGAESADGEESSFEETNGAADVDEEVPSLIYSDGNSDDELSTLHSVGTVEITLRPLQKRERTEESEVRHLRKRTKISLPVSSLETSEDELSIY